MSGCLARSTGPAEGKVCLLLQVYGTEQVQLFGNASLVYKRLDVTVLLVRAVLSDPVAALATQVWRKRQPFCLDVFDLLTLERGVGALVAQTATFGLGGRNSLFPVSLCLQGLQRVRIQ